MTSDFVATHKSIGGVPAQAFPDGTFWRVRISVGNTGIFSNAEFKMLFQEISKPKMVTMPLELAKAIRADVNRAMRLPIDDSDALERLIAAAEKDADAQYAAISASIEGVKTE